MKNTLLCYPILLVLSGMWLSSCQPGAGTPADMAQIKADIQTLEDAWAAALNARDIDALMAMYTDDAVSMPSNAPMIVGKDAIRKQQEQEFAQSAEGMTYSFEVLDVYANGNTVTETGKSTYKDSAGKVKGTGKYMVVWKKQGDTYLCAREIYSGDVPPVHHFKSIHLFDLPADVSEAEWSAVLKELNVVIADLGYPGAGYYMYKTIHDDTKNYRYYFEGVWPSPEARTKTHEDPAYIAVAEKFGPMYDKIKPLQIYRQMSLVK
jgi:uncharacterized protein (TIGR02246 family)